MPRSSAQSDFVIDRARPKTLRRFDIELPKQADPVSLPHAIWVTHDASARATKIVMWFTGITLALLLILTLVGPHIPSGE